MPSETSEPTYIARKIEMAVIRHPDHLADGYRDAKRGHDTASPTLADAIDSLNILADGGDIASIVAHQAGVVLYHLDQAAPRGYRS